MSIFIFMEPKYLLVTSQVYATGVCSEWIESNINLTRSFCDFFLILFHLHINLTSCLFSSCVLTRILHTHISLFILACYMSFPVDSSILHGIVTYVNRNNGICDNVCSFFVIRPTSVADRSCRLE
jgi:hypothetical protein